uniref:hypothetical protein n=1 Tax=Kitasatospora indigofera TaxID=67307 RepID=UPI002F911B5F
MAHHDAVSAKMIPGLRDGAQLGKERKISSETPIYDALVREFKRNPLSPYRRPGVLSPVSSAPALRAKEETAGPDPREVEPPG